MWEEMPVTQYFEPAATFFFTAQAGEDDVDLFKVPHFAANPYTYKKVRHTQTQQNHQLHPVFPRLAPDQSSFQQLTINVKLQCVVRVKKGEENEKPNANAGAVAGRRKKGGRKQQQQQHQQQGKKEQQRRKKPKAKAAAAAAAVDEDLYKISPNVICKVQKASTFFLLIICHVIGGFFLDATWIYF